jgi:hypothetical protein
MKRIKIFIGEENGEGKRNSYTPGRKCWQPEKKGQFRNWGVITRFI